IDGNQDSFASREKHSLPGPTLTLVTSTRAALPDITQFTTNATAPIPFMVDDAETPASSLVVTTSSSNTNLVPSANIILSGSDTNRTVTLTPRAAQDGVTIITLSVWDGFTTNSSSFAFTVVLPPTINA